MFWLKDGMEIDTANDRNFIISSEGDLIITQARLRDTGNYTCGARNIVTEKFSDPVPFVVYGKLENIPLTKLLNHGCCGSLTAYQTVSACEQHICSLENACWLAILDIEGVFYC